MNEHFIPTKNVDSKSVPKEFSLYENKIAHYDFRAKNIISTTLTLD